MESQDTKETKTEQKEKRIQMHKARTTNYTNRVMQGQMRASEIWTNNIDDSGKRYNKPVLQLLYSWEPFWHASLFGCVMSFISEKKNK